MPRFSVIIPVYCVEAYLDECVHSVLAQDFSDFELILVDDGSPDHCPEMCDQYAKNDTRIRVIHQKNEGLAAARNSGLRQATGDYILFLDSDDFWNSKTLLTELNNRTSPKTDIILFSCIDWEVSTDTYQKPRREYDMLQIQQSGKENVLCYLLESKLFPGGAVVSAVRRRFLESKHIRFDDNIRACEDYDWLFQIFLHADTIDAINAPYYTYRRHGGTLSTNVDAKTVGFLMKTVERWGKYGEKNLSGHLQRAFMNYLSHIYSTGFIFSGNMDRFERKKALTLMEPHKKILSYSQWRRLKLVKWCRFILGANLTSVLLKYYFDAAHRRKKEQ